MVNLNKDPSPRGIDQYWMHGNGQFNPTTLMSCGGNSGYYFIGTDPMVNTRPYAHRGLNPVPISAASNRNPRPVSDHSYMYGAQQSVNYESCNLMNNMTTTYDMLMNGFISNPVSSQRGGNSNNAAVAAYHQYLSHAPHVHGPSSSLMMFNL